MSEREPKPPPVPSTRDPRGLCPSCVHVQLVTSSKGSTFLLCGLSKTDARFPKYPPQPRMVCAGFSG